MKYLAIMLLLTACGSPPTDPVDKVPVYVAPKVDHFVSHIYRVSDTEHVVIMDIDDKYVPRRCLVFVNELTKSQTPISCNFDSAGSPMPEQE
jgi:hypothetical protein